LNDAVCHSLSDPSLVARFCDVTPVRLRNPVSEEFSVLRPSLVPQLVGAACLSARHGRRDVALFETGRVFLPGASGVEERFSVAGIVVGTLMGGRWNLKPAPLQADFYVCKALVEALLDAFNVTSACFQDDRRTGLHPGRTAKVIVGGEVAGYLGQIHPQLQNELELPGDTYVFEIDPEVLRQHGSTRSYRALPRYPAVQRDIAVVVDADQLAEQVRQVILRAGGEVVEDAEVFDVYTGPNLPAGKKSLAFSLTMRSPHSTLTDEQADAVLEAVRSALAAELGAAFR
ncbi:MAG: phenylalanine--tRNA ligase subunit beta, partial [Armatimonadota bacterium]